MRGARASATNFGMGAPFMSPQHKTELAVLGVISSQVLAAVMTGYKSQTASTDTAGNEKKRELPCYVVLAKDMPEYPKFTGNCRGNVEVTVMTDADPSDTAGDDPEVNHQANVGLVGDALAWDDLAAKLTTAGRTAVVDFTCLQARYMGTAETKVVDRHFETVHVVSVWMAPSNVSA